MLPAWRSNSILATAAVYVTDGSMSASVISEDGWLLIYLMLVLAMYKWLITIRCLRCRIFMTPVG